MSFSATDHAMMARALRLAERGAYTTRPNPMVGCVLAHGDEIVGEGWHRLAGEPHAEILALQDAGDRAKGATAYVTLEPCAHTGKTGPCADALIAAGVWRVVAAMRDPFPEVDGEGFARLAAAGIGVESGLMEAQARALNEQRVEASRMLEAVTSALAADADLLAPGELADIRAALAALSEVASGSDRRAIMTALEHVNTITEPFAARRMDRSIHQAFAGKKLEDMEI